MVCNITVNSTQHWNRMWMVLPGLVGQEGPLGAGRVSLGQRRDRALDM